MSDRKAFKVATLKKSSVPPRKSVYDWNEYFGRLEADRENAIKFSGLARTTIRQAMERYNAKLPEDATQHLVMQGRKTDTYVYFEDIPKAKEPESPEA